MILKVIVVYINYHFKGGLLGICENKVVLEMVVLQSHIF